MDYNFKEIEARWQQRWAKNKTFKAEINSQKPKYYVLDMFPYPSGAGLHVGHPLGYIASDIMARYKRLKGYNVLHPMGYDAFGLPAEQYAIQTGQHPAVTTEQNIKRYREQLDKIGFSFDWDREVRTSDPKYYKWTQWIFIQLFKTWYNNATNKAEPIESLIQQFNVLGNSKVEAATPEDVKMFSADEWKKFTEKEQQDLLMNYRLAYLSEAWVNWCPDLGTVLANDEVKDGVSERGGYPVEKKRMPQWSLRITAYAERLLRDLDLIDWSESIKEAQRNWIGRSEGSSLEFRVSGSGFRVEVFTTRPDTIFGVSFLTLAPEHELVKEITTVENKKAIDEYVAYAKSRSERDRQADVKKITGEFTGAYAVHPFTGKNIPIWIGDYVLASYGTGAVMAVPAHDTRDYAFAKYFEKELTEQLGRHPIVEVVAPFLPPPKGEEIIAGAYDAKEGKLVNSDFLNGLEVKDAVKKAIEEIEKKGLGKGKINYRLRDAAFGRQRYWGEPIPIYYKDGIAHAVDENDLPVKLPEIEKFLPTETGEPPLARATNWKYMPPFDFPRGGKKKLQVLPSGEDLGGAGYALETTTMPGWAGSSWYYLRYMDPRNDKEFASKEAVNYWKEIDLYIGGAEHATGHLLYVRFWTKFLHDLGCISITEPAKKLINQGMIGGRSNLVYRFLDTNLYISSDMLDDWGYYVSHGVHDKEIENKIIQKLGDAVFEKIIKPRIPSSTVANALHVDVNIVKNDILELKDFQKWSNGDKEAIFLTGENGKYHCGVIDNEKMGKRFFNVVVPDDICDQFGADTLRLYEMFLGPLEQHKPWNTNGITGVSNFLKKLWKLYHSPSPKGEGRGEAFFVSEDPATKQEMKTLHKTIKKIKEDIERYSFNTSVSNFMICVNELTELKCNKRAILEPLAIIISPYAPHIAEELWEKLGHEKSITYAEFPEYKEEYLTESSFNYPVSFNGKTRFFVELGVTLTKEEIEKEVLAQEQTQKYLEGKQPKKIIVVQNKIVNIVV